MATIHSTALVDLAAQLDASVTVGPYTIIGPNVVIGAGSTVGSHCTIEGFTTVGQNNHIHSYTSLGAAPQDKKYAGEPTRLVIGNDNTIREFCTFNAGTVNGGGVTQVGDDKIGLDINCFVDYVKCWIKSEKYPLNGRARITTDQTNTVPILGGLRWEMTIKERAHIRNIRHIDRLPSRYDKGGVTHRETPPLCRI
jgi:hypothetical protein